MYTFPAHPIFRFGPNFRNKRKCRAWMGTRLPFRNTYHKGVYPFLGQTRYYAPDENSGLFRWADHHSTVTFSLSPLERSPPPSSCSRPNPPCSSLCLICSYYLMFFFYFTLPRVHFLTARVHLATFFLHPQQRVISTLNYTQISCFIPLQPPFYNACSANYSSLIPQFTQLQHSLHNTVLSYSGDIHINTHLPASLPSTQSLPPLTTTTTTTTTTTNQPTNQTNYSTKIQVPVKIL